MPIRFDREFSDAAAAWLDRASFFCEHVDQLALRKLQEPAFLASVSTSSPSDQLEAALQAVYNSKAPDARTFFTDTSVSSEELDAFEAEDGLTSEPEGGTPGPTYLSVRHKLAEIRPAEIDVPASDFGNMFVFLRIPEYKAFQEAKMEMRSAGAPMQNPAECELMMVCRQCTVFPESSKHLDLEFTPAAFLGELKIQMMQWAKRDDITAEVSTLLDVLSTQEAIKQLGQLLKDLGTDAESLGVYLKGLVANPIKYISFNTEAHKLIDPLCAEPIPDPHYSEYQLEIIKNDLGKELVRQATLAVIQHPEGSDAILAGIAGRYKERFQTAYDMHRYFKESLNIDDALDRVNALLPDYSGYPEKQREAFQTALKNAKDSVYTLARKMLVAGTCNAEALVEKYFAEVNQRAIPILQRYRQLGNFSGDETRDLTRFGNVMRGHISDEDQELARAFYHEVYSYLSTEGKAAANTALEATNNNALIWQCCAIALQHAPGQNQALIEECQAAETADTAAAPLTLDPRPQFSFADKLKHGRESRPLASIAKRIASYLPGLAAMVLGVVILAAGSLTLPSGLGLVGFPVGMALLAGGASAFTAAGAAHAYSDHQAGTAVETQQVVDHNETQKFARAISYATLERPDIMYPQLPEIQSVQVPRTSLPIATVPERFRDRTSTYTHASIKRTIFGGPRPGSATENRSPELTAGGPKT